MSAPDRGPDGMTDDEYAADAEDYEYDQSTRFVTR